MKKHLFSKVTSAVCAASFILSCGSFVMADVTDGEGEGEVPAEESVELPEDYDPDAFISFDDFEYSNDDLAESYINRKMSMGDEACMGNTAIRDTLEGYELAIFDNLTQQVRDIADGKKTDTVVVIPNEIFMYSRPKSDFNADVSKMDPDFLNYYMTMYLPVNTTKLMYAVLYSCPYELYWFDKTKGIHVDFETEIVGDEVVVYNLTFEFAVAEEYRFDSELSVDPVYGQGVRNSMANAQAIVDKCAGLDDFHKIMAFDKEICKLTDYNHAAYATEEIVYGNPWQIIWVFDGDSSTDVVCEGYAKAFQYLCDNSAFENDSVRSLLVSGDCGGSHMFNIVRMDDGKNYIVDITNSDPQGEGNYAAGIILKGGTGSVKDGYNVVKTLFYKINADMVSLYGEEALTLSEDDYVYVSPTGKHEIVVGAEVFCKSTLSTYFADANEIVRVNVTPNPGYEFAYINVNGEKIYDTAFDMPDKTVRLAVVCQEIHYPITCNSAENGTVNLSADSASVGTVVYINTIPDDYYMLDYIKVNGVLIDGDSFTMPAEDVTVEVAFKSAEHAIKINGDDNGQVYINNRFANAGDVINLSIVPAPGYELVSVTVNGEAFSGDSFVMPDEDVNIDVVFNRLMYSITLNSFDHGKATLSQTTAGCGDEIELTITPDEWYEFDSIMVNDTIYHDTKFTMPDMDVTVYVKLKSVECEVILKYDTSRGECTMVLGPGEESKDIIYVPYNTQLTIIIDIFSGYYLSDIKVNGKAEFLGNAQGAKKEIDLSVSIHERNVVVEIILKEVIDAPDGWLLRDGKYYYLWDQTYVTGWLSNNGERYYLDPEEGYMYTGWHMIDDNWHYFDPNGKMHNGWLKYGDSWYFLYGPDGNMKTGFLRLKQNACYYFSSSGVMQTGWQEIEGEWYFFDNSGLMQLGWNSINGKWYYFDYNGKTLGRMFKGWKFIGGQWYYFASSGEMKSGWQLIGGKWYYLESSGKMATGWLEYKGKWYYLENSGAMFDSGWKQIGGKWYFFYNDGVMASDTSIDGYYVDSSGAWVA